MNYNEGLAIAQKYSLEKKYAEAYKQAELEMEDDVTSPLDDDDLVRMALSECNLI